MPFSYNTYEFTPLVTGVTRIDDLYRKKYKPDGTNLPGSVGLTITADNGDTYVLGRAHDNLFPSTPSLKLASGTFVTSYGSDKYVSPPVAMVINEYGWFKKTATTYVRTPLSSTVYNVKSAPYNATGDGTTNDTAAIQSAINACGSTGGTVFFPAGTYMVNGNSTTPLTLFDNINIQIDPAATIKMITSSSTGYQVFSVVTLKNITFYGGGTIQGERQTHIGSTGEFGMGISLLGCSNVVIENLIFKDFWGDGIYIGYATGPTILSQDIQVYQCYLTNNRRNNISVTGVTGRCIIDSNLSTNANGTNPQGGIDVEPDSGTTANGVIIKNNSFIGNLEDGILVTGGAGSADSAIIVNNVCCLNGNTVNSNGSGIRLADTDNCIVRGNYCANNLNFGISLVGVNSTNTVDNNACNTNGDATSPGFAGVGIFAGDGAGASTGHIITNNVMLKNKNDDWANRSTSITFTNNVFETQFP